MDAQTCNSFLEEDPLSLPVKKENVHETEQTEYLFVPPAKTDDEETIFKQSMDAQTGNSVLEEVPFSLPIKIENTHETEQKEYLFVTLSKTSDDGQTVFKQYGESCMNRGYFCKWVEQLKTGRTSMTEEQCPGRPVEMSIPSLETCIDDIFREDWHITVEQIEKKLQ
ncbi:uncharacterized protein LOC142332771 [Lycorma delicatula]|uniref:uncharacterized protein LOC142332771 n=1 Tax=Lycorma delicatula TaxID=130591 RepID=UPI003F51533F